MSIFGVLALHGTVLGCSVRSAVDLIYGNYANVIHLCDHLCSIPSSTDGEDSGHLFLGQLIDTYLREELC